MKMYVDGIGIWAPGLAGWSAAQQVLSGDKSYEAVPLPRPAPSVLPPTERRRSSNTILLAIQTAQEASESAAINPKDVATVFASCSGDMDIVHDLCTALALPERQVSPTRFHNSVFNAAAGYWSIASGSQKPSTSLSCHDFTFAAGLIESIAQIAAERQPVLLVTYDWPPPPPLQAKRPVSVAFSVGLLLSPRQSGKSLAELGVEMTTSGTGLVTRMEDENLERLRCGNPAGRVLPLLKTIACRQSDTICLDYFGENKIQLIVTPLA